MRPACASTTVMASGNCSAQITGTLRLMIAAFSPAIHVSVSPRNPVWSMRTAATTFATGAPMIPYAPARATSDAPMGARRRFGWGTGVPAQQGMHSMEAGVDRPGMERRRACDNVVERGLRFGGVQVHAWGGGGAVSGAETI